MKDAVFVGDAREILRGVPALVRREVGYEIDHVQNGREPRHWKPLNAVGPGVKEIRIRDESGAYRVVYTANFADAVYVLYAFQKKTQKTPTRDLEIAAARFRHLVMNR